MDLDGKVIVEPRFVFAGDFQDGRAPFRRDGLYGFIDREGKEVIPPKFTLARGFSHGAAFVRINTKSMYTDPKGKLFGPQ
jgi:hypothetical protein